MGEEVTVLTYDDDSGDFSFRPIVPAGRERQRAAELALAGMRNVCLTTYKNDGAVLGVVKVERCATADAPGGKMIVWSTDEKAEEIA